MPDELRLREWQEEKCRKSGGARWGAGRRAESKGARKHKKEEQERTEELRRVGEKARGKTWAGGGGIRGGRRERRGGRRAWPVWLAHVPVYGLKLFLNCI